MRFLYACVALCVMAGHVYSEEQKYRAFQMLAMPHCESENAARRLAQSTLSEKMEMSQALFLVPECVMEEFTPLAMFEEKLYERTYLRDVYEFWRITVLSSPNDRTPIAYVHRETRYVFRFIGKSY